ncbi:MAG: rRNA pseudouridine synthase [Firmicutes bacterium]|nr:rRNA pseudouridine synthase [Bacillota bacterium]
MQVRLAKYLAQSGVASRRKAEELISAGLVQVNGETVRELGRKVDPDRDRVTVEGQEVAPAQEPVYLLLHKPAGYVTTVRDPWGRPTVMDLVPGKYGRFRLFPAGRLDQDTTGLLLLTNDGAVAQALTHPRYRVPKVYEALVRGVPQDRALRRLRRGIRLEDGFTLPAKVDILRVEAGNATLRITVYEGRKRLIRRMCRAAGHPVLALKRVAMGPLVLGDLPAGKIRALKAAEVKKLLGIGDLPGQAKRKGAQRPGKEGS